MSEEGLNKLEPEDLGDALLALVAEVELPDGYVNLRAGDPDRLGALAAWWGTVSSSRTPAHVTLAWSDPPGPDAAPGVLATLSALPDDVPAGITEAIAWGAEQADRAVDAGADLVVLRLPPELSGSTEPPGAAELPVHVLLASHLLQLDAVEASGWPSEDGLTDSGWVARVAGLRDGLRQVRDIYGEPQRLLSAIDGRMLAAGAGLLARTTARRTPTLLDGSAAGVVGLLVRRAEPATRAWWQATDGGDLLHDRVLKELRLQPLLQLGLESGPRGRPAGFGGRLGLAVLETALQAAGPVDPDRV